MTATQLGRFKVSIRAITDFPDEVALTFALMGAVVVRAEAMYFNHSIEYVAVSRLFEDIPEGAITPEYMIEVQKDDHGAICTVIAKRLP